MREGQGLLLEIDYADGGSHNKPRTFLIIDIDVDNIHMLNVSSIKGKERKLGFKSNKKIENFKPPFMKPSFIKLDALYSIERNDILDNFVLFEGRAIHPKQLNQIKDDFETYKEKYKVCIKESNIDNIISLNIPSLAESAMTSKKDD